MKRHFSFLVLVCLIAVMLSGMIQAAYALNINFSGNGNGITISGADFPSMTRDENIATLVKKPLDKYKSMATAVTGFATVTAFLALIFCITKLSAAGDNGQARHRAMMGILTSGIGVALLGGATVIIGFFWNLFL